MSQEILDEILTWSAERPAWQRDALRRLFASGELIADDISDLLALCKTPHGLNGPAVAQPLSQANLAAGSTRTAPVTLTSLTHHAGVNALAPEQTVTFGSKLTVVYGPNAAGKSGYTRILKRACRSRASEDLLSDLVSGQTPLAAGATIRFHDGAASDAAWTLDQAPSDALAAVSVFDAHCAPVYLRDRTDVAFRPFGLDVFDRLAAACGQVSDLLRAEQKALAEATQTLPTLPSGTRAQALVSTLTSLTSTDDVRALATLSDGEARRLRELQDQRKDMQAADPKRLARDLTLKAQHFDLVARHAGAIVGALAAPRLVTLRKAVASRDAARATVDALRRTTITPDLLPGTGDEIWRALWNAATTFSQAHAVGFPTASGDSRCPLCQQPIGSEAADRVRHLAEFATSRAQADAQQAQQDVDSALQTILHPRAQRDDVALAISELEAADPELAQRVRTLLAGAADIQTEATRTATEGTEVAPYELDLALQADATTAATILRERAHRLSQETPALPPEALAELAELESRAMLNDNLSVVLAEIERKKRLAAYTACLTDTNTQAITRKGTELTKRLVTDQLRSTFQTELVKLDFLHLAIEIQPVAGARGVLYHRLAFSNAPGVTVTNVLSEGESRTLSLAAFLTELSTAPTLSTIIFDDPVSSLDHIWRERIARRLAEESRMRQVIVFTHDLLFLRLLLDEADRQGVECAHQYVRRDGQAGICSPDLPWIAMNTKDRLGVLRKRWQDAEKTFRVQGADAYERDGREIYGLLRETWELATAEVLLNSVAEPYRPSIETRRVRPLHDISEADCGTIDREMSECSRWIRGHTQAPADATPFPTPDKLKARIDVLDDWVRAIRKRRG